MNQYINSHVLDKNQEVPSLPDTKLHRDKLMDGAQFHLVMRQMGLGIPVDELLATHPQFKRWVDAAFPYTQIPGNKRWNVDLCHKFNDVYLIENYDFIVSNDDKTIAINWTIGEPQDTLEKLWKTQLRLFLLQENTGVKCENISLIYLFANSETMSQCCYSDRQHEENKQKLNTIIPPIKSQIQAKNDLVAEIHTGWLAGNVNTQEYLNAIPEVEL